MEMYSAGTHTTVATLAWLFLFLSKNPEVQKKVQEEIGTVTNNNSTQCSLSHRLKYVKYGKSLIKKILN